MRIANNKFDTNIRFYTHNVRYATTSPTRGEKLWKDRKQYVVNSILFNVDVAPLAFVCLQEVLYPQLQDILKALGDEWTYIGVARDDGKKSGEFNPILYKHAVWKLLDHSTTWLSATPNVPSKGWDGGSYRILNWGLFQAKHNSTVAINVFNTHLDNEGVVARREGAKIIIKHYKEKAILHPLVLTGDFNSPPEDEAYKIVHNSLTDSYLSVEKPLRYGHFFTYTGFNSDEPKTRIDFIWTSSKVKVKRSGVLHSDFDATIFSDHRPVVSDVTI